MINIFKIFFNVKSSITKEDFSISRYYFIWNHHSKKRSYTEFLEKHTLEEVNNLIKELFPKRIPKKVKMQLVDCLIIFLRSCSLNYDYFSKKWFKIEFANIIKFNYEKIAKQNN